MTLLARRYATALHQAASTHGAVAAVERDLADLHAALADPRARALLTSPDVGSDERAQIVDRLARGRHPLVGNTMQVALRRRRQEVLFDLYPAFRALVLADRGEVEGVVETAAPLGDAEVQRLRALAARLCGKQVSFTVRVQTALEQLEQRLLRAAI
jgi:F0F1-type ATP synthase delta subunit